MLVVSLAKFCQRLPEFLDIAEGPQPEELLFKCPEKSLDAPVSLGLSNEGWRRFHAEKANLVLKVVAHVHAAVIVAEPQTEGGIF